MKYSKFCVKKRYCIHKHFTQFFLLVLRCSKRHPTKGCGNCNRRKHKDRILQHTIIVICCRFLKKRMKSTNTMSSSSLKTFDYVLVQWLENIVLQHFHQFGVLFSFVNETKNVCSYGYMRILNRNTDVKS